MVKENNKAPSDPFSSFCETIAALRHPKTGCPWDLEQTHATLRKYMIEEAYEAADVMDPLDPKKLCEELGDVLLQVVLNSQLASESRNFDINDVIASINQKMRRRHPHVFGDESERAARTSLDVSRKWEEIKKAEDTSTKSQSVFSGAQDSPMTPASRQAVAIGKIAHTINFDWTTVMSVMSQVKSEIEELNSELLLDSGSSSQSRIYDEMGDVFFSLAQLCRHLKIDPEICAMDGNRKFLRRFHAMEAIATKKGLDVRALDSSSLESLWSQAKKEEQ